MISFDIPADTTVESLLCVVAPSFHALLVPADAPVDLFSVAVSIQGAGGFTLRIRGREMRVEPHVDPRPTLWIHTTARDVTALIQDALGPRRWVPLDPKGQLPSGVVAFSDPRLLKRAAMASGRIEVALVDTSGERFSAVLGFGPAARRAIDPEAPDAVVEVTADTMARVLAGALPPDRAITDGGVRIRGSRFLPMQLALAAAPFYPAGR
jgi:hypothetical protein